MRAGGNQQSVKFSNSCSIDPPNGLPTPVPCCPRLMRHALALGQHWTAKPYRQGASAPLDARRHQQVAATPLPSNTTPAVQPNSRCALHPEPATAILAPCKSMVHLYNHSQSLLSSLHLRALGLPGRVALSLFTPLHEVRLREGREHQTCRQATSD